MRGLHGNEGEHEAGPMMTRHIFLTYIERLPLLNKYSNGSVYSNATLRGPYTAVSRWLNRGRTSRSTLTERQLR